MPLNLSLAKKPDHMKALKAAAVEKIDKSTGEVRKLFITDTPGQELVYKRKLEHAERFLANPSVPQGQISAIVGEAADEGLTVMQKAVQIVSQSEAWGSVSDPIERRRLAAKRAVKAATNPAEIEAAANVDWSDIIALAPT